MQYNMFKETLWNRDIGNYKSFGVSYKNTVYIPDISTEENSLSNFINQLNKDQADIKHIYNLIDNYLAM